jgi:hypothetical protein
VEFLNLSGASLTDLDIVIHEESVLPTGFEKGVLEGEATGSDVAQPYCSWCWSRVLEHGQLWPVQVPDFVAPGSR